MKKIFAMLATILIICLGGYFFIFKNINLKYQTKDIVTISAAASLYEPLNKAKEIYEGEHKGVKVDINFASSSTLEKQIEQGAPVDLFISASPKYTTELIEKNIISKDNVSNFLGNKLVLARSMNATNIDSIEELKNTKGKIALGDKAVPVGIYGEEAFSNLGILNSITERIAYCKDAMAILNYLENGEVDYGVIYENELVNAKNVIKVADFPKYSHQSIIYTMATLNNKDNTKEFREFLLSDNGKSIFKENGFEVY